MNDDASAPRASTVSLVLASFVVLGLELTLIRWIPGQVRVLAYFPNVVLISTFLGLGIGCLLVVRRIPVWTFSPLLVVLTGTTVWLSRFAFTQESTNEHLWLLYFDLPNAPVVNGIRLPIVTLFVLSAAVFVPLGHFIASRLQDFRAAGSSLRGYAADLGGSLLGVIAFTLLFFSGTFPVVWFAVVLVIAPLLWSWRKPRLLIVHGICAAAVLLLVHAFERADVYSPYYAIKARKEGYALAVLTNGSLHQNALPLRMEQQVDSPALQITRGGYHLPYRLLRRKPRHVLILGAGTGNDVSVALNEGARHVDAVEIDPSILRIGRQSHPDRPYGDPRVRAINTDGRAFLNDSRAQYDLIVFGTLDSMTRLSALSNVRLDNFVYTVESIRAAARHLTPDGGMVLLFEVKAPYIEQHIAAMLWEALGEKPIVIRREFVMFNRIFLTGPAFRHLQRPGPVPDEEARRIATLIDMPTDDWPFLYLKGRGVSSFYLSLIAVIATIAVAAVFAVSREMRETLRERQIDWPMFFFGLAFLLLETKLITQVSLIWGATWLTSAVVFGSILVTILIGTLWTKARPIPWNFAAPALIISLLLTWLIPAHVLVGRPWPLRLFLSVLYVGLPILFASICFAILFEERERPSIAFGWNMLGAVAGGLVEFSSMAIGIKATTLLAAVVYMLAFLLRRRAPEVSGAREPRAADTVPRET
jgi:predicted membrane-bound spermidine synthase